MSELTYVYTQWLTLHNPTFVLTCAISSTLLTYEHLIIRSADLLVQAEVSLENADSSRLLSALRFCGTESFFLVLGTRL